MEKQLQDQQLIKDQERKRFLRKRLAIFIAGALFFTAGVVALLLSSGRVIPRVIPYEWSSPLSAILLLSGLLLTLWALLFPLPPIEPKQSTSALSSAPPDVPGNNDNLAGSATNQSSLITINTSLGQDRSLSNGQEGGKSTVPTSSSSIFLVNAPLTDPQDFYGRELERTQLIRATRNGASTSIVGPRRIGKTWMMSYLRLVASGELGSNYRIGYLDASHPRCKTVAGFTKKALEELGCNTALLGRSRMGLNTLGQYLETMKLQNQIPTLCIDEFEGFNNRQEFDLNFFAGLRAMTQDGLVLVTASRKSLKDVLVDMLGETSPFFNVFYPIPLHPFSTVEAKAFADAKSIEAGFTDEEGDRLLKYGLEYGPQAEEQWPPFRLQLAGQMLLDDKNHSRIDLDRYRPNDPRYWQDFKKRLEESYQAVVR